MTDPQSCSIANVLIGIALLVPISPVGFAQVPIVTTVAGGYIGDGRPAIDAAFNQPWMATEDSSGNLFISDSLDSRIRKVNPQGIVTTIAGTGGLGDSGDGGPARSAVLRYPEGIAVDKVGNVYFCDAGNGRIRKIDKKGIITTFAGGGADSPGDGGPATNATLSWPTGLFFDSTGNLFIADAQGPTIRMVDTAGIIHLVAGVYNNFGYTGDGRPATSAELNNPQAVALDSAANLYIADSGNNRIRKVDSAGIITTFAGNGEAFCPVTGDGGQALSASVPGPIGLVVQLGRLLITGCSRIRAVNLNTNIIGEFAGTGEGCFNGDGRSPLATELCGPLGLSLDSSGNLVETESGGRIRKITRTVQTIAGGYVGDGGSSLKASLTIGFPGNNLAFDDLGDLYIADTGNLRVRKIDIRGVITTFAGTGISGSSGNGGPAASATLNYPDAVATDHSGNVFIADAGIIRKVDANGIIKTFSQAVSFAAGLATDASGNLYAADFLACVVWKITPKQVTTIIAGVQQRCGYNGDGIPATQAQLAPLGVATDSNGNVYIADFVNNRIRMVDTSGTITTVAGNGNFGFGGDGGPATSAELSLPQGVSVDKSGNIYIADTGNLRVRFVNSAGTIQTLAGTGIQGYNGDRMPATQTNIDPVTVTTNASGTPFLMDADGDLVRRIK